MLIFWHNQACAWYSFSLDDWIIDKMSTHNKNKDSKYIYRYWEHVKTRHHNKIIHTTNKTNTLIQSKLAEEVDLYSPCSILFVNVASHFSSLIQIHSINIIFIYSCCLVASTLQEREEEKLDRRRKSKLFWYCCFQSCISSHNGDKFIFINWKYMSIIKIYLNKYATRFNWTEKHGSWKKLSFKSSRLVVLSDNDINLSYIMLIYQKFMLSLAPEWQKLGMIMFFMSFF